MRRLAPFAPAAALAASLAASLAACSLPPSGGEGLRLASRDFGFVDEPLRGAPGRPRGVEASLFLPAEAVQPLPAVVMLHSSIGQGSQDWLYVERLNGLGIAVLAVDSFGARGVEKTVEDPTLVSEASMLADAFAGLALLAADPRIDPTRIAVLGFSKGGIAALYAAFESLARPFAPPGRRFAAHLAYYPWCGLGLAEPRTSGAPVLVLAGGRDEVAPPELCAALLEQARRLEPDAELRLLVLPGARHAFDHPLLAWFARLPVGGLVPGDCRFEERAPGRWAERVTGREATADSLAEILVACGREGVSAGGDPAAAEAAWREASAFLGRALGLSRQPAE